MSSHRTSIAFNLSFVVISSSLKLIWHPSYFCSGLRFSERGFFVYLYESLVGSSYVLVFY
jgi:hypothetical protein